MDAQNLSLITSFEVPVEVQNISAAGKGPAMNSALQDENFLGELIKKSIDGDFKAIETIYNLFKKKISGLIYRHTQNQSTTEDLTQEIFIKVFNNLKNVREAATFPAWVMRIAINECYSYLRQERNLKGKTVALDEIESMVCSVESADSGEHQDLARWLEAATASLSPLLRQVFVLHDVQGYKHEEIARILSCSVGTSKSSLFKARRKIRIFLIENKAI